MDTLSELARDERAKNRQIKEDAESFNRLLASPEWKRLLSIVEAVAQNYYASVMKPLESSLEVTKLEYNKGVLAGLSLATSLPQMKIREAHELRLSAKEEE